MHVILGGREMSRSIDTRYVVKIFIFSMGENKQNYIHVFVNVVFTPISSQIKIYQDTAANGKV